MSRDASNGWRGEYRHQGVAQPEDGECPRCGGELRREGSCPTCTRCGWSRCEGGKA